MTWHQWHELYPIDRKTSFFSFLAFSNASGPHGYQSTGLWACWSRYGLDSFASRLVWADSLLGSAAGSVMGKTRRRAARRMGDSAELRAEGDRQYNQPHHAVPPPGFSQC